ncbi:unnamed protein product [Adineta steineri]|uniref:Uncharacterized protein n=1 Tax=Adineta steineri TaxID=433720 RepID=A0A818UFY7_9BILA|nr:unnamed protein product [Adineta steineri]CAF3687792.1 unnamed protein product [Adineta steineri]CAF3696585.1 unnamed protein product [Adineta steineri]
MPHDTTIPYEENPNHMIIWLDQTIGDPEKCIPLKKAFSSQADPKNETPVKLRDKDYAGILDIVGPVSVAFEGVEFLFAAFTNVESCIECFEQNQDKRIFFITSGSMGEIIIPQIISKFANIFTNPETDESYNSIYIFCLNKEYHSRWARAFRNYVQIFDFETDLLSRMIHDIADYFLTEGKQLLDEDPPNYPAAKHRLTWSHELYQRYDKMGDTDNMCIMDRMEKVPVRKELNEVNELLENIDDEMASSSDEDD